MKKLLFGLSFILIIAGCGKEEVKEVNEPPKEEEKVETPVLSASEYYDVAISTIGSDTEGSISGNHTIGALQGGVTLHNYTGTISKGNIYLSGTEANIEQFDFTLEDNIKSAGEQLRATTQGIVSVYNIDVNFCETSERVLTCSYSEITEAPIEGDNLTPSNTMTSGKSYTFVFTFDENNLLKKVDIEYANVFDLVMYDNKTNDIISEVIQDFFDAPELQFFAGKSIAGGMEFGTETIDY